MINISARRLLLVGMKAVLLVALAGCASTDVASGGITASSSEGATTPLGCPAPVPALSEISDRPQLECTERELIGRVCDLNPDVLIREPPSGLSAVFLVRYQAPGSISHADFVYTNNPDLSSDGVSLACTSPPYPAKRGSVMLRRQDWDTIAAAGADLPAVLQPQKLAISRAPSPASPPVSSAAPATVAPNPGDNACATQATSVFGELAAHRITLPRAQAQLPAKVPPSALVTGLQGVKRYESEGISPHDAISEVSGAIAQSCEY